jgi:hypothetical protein
MSNSNKVILLESIRKMLHISVTGSNFIPYSHVIELLQIFDQVSQTEDVAVQISVLMTLQQVISEHGEVYLTMKEQSIDFEDEAGITVVLSKTVKVIFNVFAYLVSGISRTPAAMVSSSKPLNAAGCLAITKAVNVSCVLASSKHLTKSQRNEMQTAFMTVFSILCDAQMQYGKDVMPTLLLSLKAVLESDVNSRMVQRIVMDLLVKLDGFLYLKLIVEMTRMRMIVLRQ